MPNNVVREQQLESVASAAKDFAFATQEDTLSLVIEALATAASLPSSVVASKTTPNLSIGSWTKNVTTYTNSITYDGDGTLKFIQFMENDIAVMDYNLDGDVSQIELYVESGQTIIAFAEATASYTAAVAVYTVE